MTPVHDDALPAGDGELVVQRGDDVIGVLVPLKVRVDDVVVGALLPNQWLAARVASGDHRVCAGRSRAAVVTVPAGGAAHVLAMHPPMPSRWAMTVAPFRSSRPTVTVVAGPVAGPGPGERTAAQTWLERWVPSAASGLLLGTIAFGWLLAVVGLLLAVLGRNELVLAVAGVTMMTAGFGVAVATHWMKGRLPPQ